MLEHDESRRTPDTGDTGNIEHCVDDDYTENIEHSVDDDISNILQDSFEEGMSIAGEEDTGKYCNK